MDNTLRFPFASASLTAADKPNFVLTDIDNLAYGVIGC